MQRCCVKPCSGKGRKSPFSGKEVPMPKTKGKHLSKENREVIVEGAMRCCVFYCSALARSRCQPDPGVRVSAI